jgi:uncharacterized protein YqgQ
MNIKELLDGLQRDFDITYTEARVMLTQHLRKMYEDGVIDKEVWKAAKKILTKELQ